MVLHPFLSFYGGKYRASKFYPAPRYDTIIEPFAGSAGYSVRNHTKKVILVDKDPIIAGIWQYLLSVSTEEMTSLPDIQAWQSIDELPIPQEAKWLIGFWVNAAASKPCKVPSAWMRSGKRPNCFWGPAIRSRIANQLIYIRHWSIICGDYRDAPDIEATWFVDPPYENMGKHYRCNDIDYVELAEWCRARRGQVMVCENDGATWLPFTPFIDCLAAPNKNGAKKSKGVLWMQERR